MGIFNCCIITTLHFGINAHYVILAYQLGVYMIWQFYVLMVLVLFVAAFVKTIREQSRGQQSFYTPIEHHGYYTYLRARMKPCYVMQNGSWTIKK